MKKNLVIVLLIIGVTICGIFVFSSKPKLEKENVVSTQTSKKSTPVKELKIEEPATTGKSKNEIQNPEINSSNPPSLSGSYRCTYTLEGGLKVTTYIKNGKMRTEILLESGDTNISLYTDNKVYQWSKEKKQGIFMSVEDAKKQSGTEVLQTPDEYLNNIKNKYKPDCKDTALSNSLFALPKDVQFQDLSEALGQ